MDGRLRLDFRSVQLILLKQKLILLFRSKSEYPEALLVSRGRQRPTCPDGVSLRQGKFEAHHFPTGQLELRPVPLCPDSSSAAIQMVCGAIWTTSSRRPIPSGSSGRVTRATCGSTTAARHGALRPRADAALPVKGGGVPMPGAPPLPFRAPVRGRRPPRPAPATPARRHWRRPRRVPARTSRCGRRPPRRRPAACRWRYGRPPDRRTG